MKTRHPARTSWSRRDMLRGSAAALMGAYGLAPRDGLAADTPLEYDGSKFQIAAPEPNPKRGGVMRYGILNRPPHFDVHQSGTVGNIGTQGCTFDNLIRRDPRDSGKTIIPDLAHSWEIAKDGKTYTFHLRQGVQFHDGTDFTSADVKATFDRIAKPPTGISIPRTPLFRAVSEINARDKYTVEFKLTAPRSINFMMSAFASGWNVIYSKKALEENNYDLRKVLAPLMTGGFICPFSEFATPKDQLAKRLGYQDDSGAAFKEAKSLLAAAGRAACGRWISWYGTSTTTSSLARPSRRCCGRWVF